MALKARAELEIRRRARLDGPLQGFIPAVTPRWSSPRHLSRLTDLFERIAAGERVRALVSVPPQHGKTETLLHGLAWLLRRRPWLRNAYASYAASLAFTKSRLARDYATAAGVQLRDDANKINEWVTTSGGGLLATGVGGPLTGNPVDGVLLVDDPHKNRAEAESGVVREQIKGWWTSTAMTRVHPQASILVVHTRWHCLLPMVTVVTTMGTKAIAHLREGDEVLTSGGVQRVLAAGSRPHRGDVLSIRTFGYPRPLQLTPEHQVLTPSGWVPAGDIKAGDWMVLPIQRHLTTLEDLRSLLPPPPSPRPARAVPRVRRVESDRPKPWRDHLSEAARVRGRTAMEAKVPPAELKGLIEQGTKYDDIARHFGLRDKQTVWRYARAYGVTPPAAQAIRGIPTDDPDFWRLVGYWLAEGTLTEGRKGSGGVVRFSFGKTETHLAEDVRTVMRRYGIESHIRPHGGSLTVTFSSRQVASLLERFGHGAHGKFLPDWAVRLPAPFAHELVRGLVDGDGCISSDATQGWARIASVSLSLLDGVRRMLATHGVVASIMGGDRGAADVLIDGVVEGRSSGLMYELRFFLAEAPWMFERGKANRLDAETRAHLTRDGRPGPKRTARIEGDRLLVRVKSVEVDHYDGLVYDIKTPSHDFVAEGVTVHNSDDLIGWLHHERPEGWDVIELRAIADGTDPLDPRAPGEALWPEYMPADFLAERREDVGPYDWASLYDQRPRPRGGSVFGDVHRYTALPARYRVAIGLDLAYTEKTSSDYSVAVVLAEKDGLYYLLDVVRLQCAAPAFGERLRLLKATYPGAKLVGYVGGTERGVVDLLNRPDGDRPGLGIVAKPATADKFVRAQPVAAKWNAGKVLVPATAATWADAFVSELAIFTGQKDRHDDQIDALAACYDELAKAPVSVTPTYSDDEDTVHFGSR